MKVPSTFVITTAIALLSASTVVINAQQPQQPTEPQPYVALGLTELVAQNIPNPASMSYDR